MIRLALVVAVFLAIGLAQGVSAEPAAEKSDRPAKVESAPEQRPETRRPTAVERWRGRPYRSANHEIIRNEALDKALPPANPVFQGGASLRGF